MLIDIEIYKYLNSHFLPCFVRLITYLEEIHIFHDYSMLTFENNNKNWMKHVRCQCCKSFFECFSIYFIDSVRVCSFDVLYYSSMKGDRMWALSSACKTDQIDFMD